MIHRRRPCRAGAWTAILTAGWAGCSGEFEGPPASLARVAEPVALAALPDGCTVLVANGNFDLQERGGAVVVADVASRRIVAGAGVEIGSFAAQMRVHPGGGRGYVTVRGDDSVTWFDVGDADGDGRPDLSCGDGPGGRCGRDRRMRLRKEAGGASLVTEPLSLELTCDRTGGAGRCDVPRGGELGLVTTWLRSGTVAYFPLDDEGRPVALDDTGIRLTESDQRQAEATVPGVAGLSLGPDGRTGYVTSFADDRLRRFRIEPGGASARIRLDQDQRIVGGTHDGRLTEIRGLAVDGRGDRLFLSAVHPTLNRAYPTQIYVVDAPTDTEGLPDYRVTAVVPVPGTPGLLRVLPAALAGTAGDQLFAVIFGADDVLVVDGMRLDVTAVIDVGRGPFDLTFVTPAAGSACALNDEGRPRREAWVTEFGAGRLAVVELDPASEAYHQVVAYVR